MEETKDIEKSSQFLKEREEFKDSTAYEVKLDRFEGPLDLLLFLIKEAKIDIKDIFVSKITDEYLKYIESMKELPMEKVGDFIEMAATLIEIKSKKLLPKLEEAVEDEESPEQKLIKRLEEYKLFKEISEELKVIDDADKFYKDPEPSAGDYRYVLKDMNFSGLLDAFTSLMNRFTMRAEVPSVKKIQKDRFTVAQKIGQIKDSLMVEKEIHFTSLFDSDYSKSEIINTFLAVLELLKRQYIHAIQESAFEDILITKSEEASEENLAIIKTEFE